MHIQHTKLTDAKFWQYANQISYAHAKYKLFLEEYTEVDFDRSFFLPAHTNYDLSKSSWDHELYHFLVMQITSHIVSLSQYLGFPWQRKVKVHGPSWIQMKHELLHILAKQIYQIWLTILFPRSFYIAHANIQDNCHNPNFMIFNGFRGKVMSTCQILRWLNKPFPLSNRITILVKDPGLNAPEFALRPYNFNIIRESDMNSVFTFSVAVGARDRQRIWMFNSKLVIAFVAVLMSFDSLMSKVTYFTLIVSWKKFDQWIFCIALEPKWRWQSISIANLSENLQLYIENQRTK